MNGSERLKRFAELTVSVGANEQAGQLVVIAGLVEFAPLMREIARAACRTSARSTRPLQVAGTVVRDLEFEFRDGRIVDVKASAGADVVRAELAIDENASQLGEVSLVDGSSEVGKLGLTFFNTLFDENATCHLAYGAGFAYAVDDAAGRATGLNESGVHTDFMVGGPEVEIDGKERTGALVPVMRDNQFQIG
jgi:aminopeptidase